MLTLCVIAFLWGSGMLITQQQVSIRHRHFSQLMSFLFCGEGGGGGGEGRGWGAGVDSRQVRG